MRGFRQAGHSNAISTDPDCGIAAGVAPDNIAHPVALVVVGIEGCQAQARSTAEPQRAVWPRCDALETGTDRVFGDNSGGGDAPESLGGWLGKPQRAIRSRRDVSGAATRRWQREFGDHSGGGDAPDL